jgi:hypothetical protein
MKEKRKGKYKTRKENQPNVENSTIHQALFACIISLIIIGSMITFIGVREGPYQKQKNFLPGEFNSASPAAGVMHILPSSIKTFSIDTKGYENIRWYVNEKKVSEGNAKYEFQAMSGNHTIRVEMQNGTRSESISWEVIVEEKNNENPLPPTGAIGFYVLLSMIIIVISIILFIFIIEKNRRDALSEHYILPEKQENPQRGRINEPRNFKSETRNDEAEFFNIPS